MKLKLVKENSKGECRNLCQKDEDGYPIMVGSTFCTKGGCKHFRCELHFLFMRFVICKSL